MGCTSALEWGCLAMELYWVSLVARLLPLFKSPLSSLIHKSFLLVGQTKQTGLTGTIMLPSLPLFLS